MARRPYLIADLFCGAGGSSTGAEKAIAEIGGKMELVAVNHWDTAIATHSANHPKARHYIENLETADPEAIVPEGRLDLLMASPECKYHSRARGGKPIHDQGRMQPWAVHNWLSKLDVAHVIIENVPEFVEWGPVLPNGMPDKTKKGAYFEAWFKALWALGYDAEWRMLNAADYGDATTRTRFFLLARKDGNPIVWPEATHAKPSADPALFGKLKPWRAAKEIIDWSDQGRSILDDPKYRKKPLSEKTRRRIARGLEKFGGEFAPLYIRLLALDDEEGRAAFGATTEGAKTARQPFHGSDRQHTLPRSMDQPLFTVTTLTGGGQYAVRPLLKPMVGANRTNNVPKPVDYPIPVITTAPGGGSFIMEPRIKSFMLSQQAGGAPRSTEQPVSTITTDGAISLTKPMAVPYGPRAAARSTEEPLPTIMTKDRLGLAQPALVEYYGASGGASVQEPLPTVTTKARHGLVDPALIEVNHGGGGNRRAHSVDEPLGTLTTRRGLGLANPVLVQTSQTGGNGSYTRSPDQPLPTMTTKADMAIAMSGAHLVPKFGERPGQDPRVHDIDEPVPTITADGAGRLVSPMLVQTVLKEVGPDFDPRRLVLVDGHLYILDIMFRMLRNRELARATSFGDDEFEYHFAGTVAEITKQIGNAVPVRTARALVMASFARRRRARVFK